MKNIKVGDECYMSSDSVDFISCSCKKYKRKILAMTSDGQFVTECNTHVEKWKYAFLVPKIELYNRKTFPKDGAWIKREGGKEHIVLAIGDEGVGTFCSYLTWAILADKVLIRTASNPVWRPAHL